MSTSSREGAAGRMMLAALAAVAVSAHAESLLDFDRWMQQIDRHSQGVLRHIQQEDTPAALDDARALAQLYGQMERFYERRGNADDAVLASFVGRGQAEQAASALLARHPQEAYEQASALARDCRSCHERYKPMRN